MEPIIWNIFSLVFKLIIYVGFANAIAFPRTVIRRSVDEIILPKGGK